MSDNEIIKALDICGHLEGCADCPLGYLEGVDKCMHTLLLNALGLINRQKAEIEKLKLLIINNDEEQMSDTATRIKEEQERIQIEHVQSLKAQIEWLENKLFDAKQGTEFYKANFMAKCEEIDKIKTEAIKEFAEKMKGVIPDIDDTYIERIVEDYIDNLVKEMGGGNG